MIREFIDRHTGKYYRKGDNYISNDLKRIAELQEAGFLERVPLPAFEQEAETAMQEAPENAMQPKRKRKK